ncbi:hypothetical protein LSAT2_011607 [Lamellibrachia satsuma]|nr:hypothetical protein LSAT2_011607 [Lamellibrachia satsuma]
MLRLHRTRVAQAAPAVAPERHSAMDDRIHQLTLRHDNIRSTSQKTRETIMEVVGWLESENAQLRNLNADIMAQMRRLADGNDRIKKQLASSQTQQQQNSSRVATLQETNNRLKADLEAVARKHRDEKRRVEEREAVLRDENAAMQRQIDAMKADVSEMEAALARARQETDSATAQLSRAQRRNFNDRDIELLHDLDVLRDQQRHAQRQSDEANAANATLQGELGLVQASFDEKVAELRNESRRHSLLTKEFNSLLDENNKLKQQMRRRRQGALMQQQQQATEAAAAATTTTTTDLGVCVARRLHGPEQYGHGAFKGTPVRLYIRALARRNYAEPHALDVFAGAASRQPINGAQSTFTETGREEHVRARVVIPLARVDFLSSEERQRSDKAQHQQRFA